MYKPINNIHHYTTSFILHYTKNTSKHLRRVKGLLYYKTADRAPLAADFKKHS